MDYETLKMDLNLATSDQMVDQVAFIIWSSVVSTTIAFNKVEVKFDSDNQRIFISINLKWWARIRKFEILRKYWLAKAERRGGPHIPSGWKSLFYYK